jgi:predicted CXXCH cytochrome family protein
MIQATPNQTKTKVGLVGVLVLLGITACTAGSNGSFLSFFWGPPEGDQSQTTKVKPESGWHYLTAEEKIEFEAAKKSKAWVSWHKPYKELSCPECHKITRRPEGAPGQDTMIPVPPDLILPMEDLCEKCHEPAEKRYVHGPVASLSCEICHEPHKSRNPHLVKAKEVKDLCGKCHEGDTFTTAKQHETVAEQSCLVCHDPHGSSQDWLRKAGTPELKTLTDPNAKKSGK